MEADGAVLQIAGCSCVALAIADAAMQPESARDGMWSLDGSNGPASDTRDCHVIVDQSVVPTLSGQSRHAGIGQFVSCVNCQY